MPSAPLRLDRLLAERGVPSRAIARDHIKRGRVRVDGEIVRRPAEKVAPDALVSLDDRPLTAPPTLAVLHKPAGVQCTVGDPLGRPSLEELAAELLALRLHPVGRLDADSDGLLPFALDGALTQRLLHPRHAVDKEYIAAVDGVIPDDLAALLADGVQTAHGVHTAELRAVDGDRVRLVVHEGKHRMVRRMLANLGLPVRSLRRVRFGAMTLGDLPEGTWREATADELAWAEALLAR